MGHALCEKLTVRSINSNRKLFSFLKKAHCRNIKFTKISKLELHYSTPNKISENKKRGQ